MTNFENFKIRDISVMDQGESLLLAFLCEDQLASNELWNEMFADSSLEVIVKTNTETGKYTFILMRKDAEEGMAIPSNHTTESYPPFGWLGTNEKDLYVTVGIWGPHGKFMLRNESIIVDRIERKTDS